MHLAVYAFAAVAVAAFGGWLLARGLLRYARRRWRRWLGGPGGAVGVVLTGGLGGSLFSLADPRWWSAQLDRQRMWRSVAAATSAVERARAAGAPVGNLPRLSRRLKAAAADLDPVVALTHHASRTDHRARCELRSLLEAAEELRTAAVEALHDHAQPHVADVVSSVRLEAAAFHAGLARARQAEA